MNKQSKMNRFINDLDRKIGRYAPPNLMFFMVVAMFAIFLVDLLYRTLNVWSYLYFDSSLILSGQWWRVISFLFLPPSSSVVWILFSLYFYYLIGSSLEAQWGSFKFCFYYLIGVIGTIIGGFITGYTSNGFLNMSLFFAFAVLFPNYQVLLFFFIPIEIKWLALLDAAYFVFTFLSVTGEQRLRLSCLCSTSSCSSTRSSSTL